MLTKNKYKVSFEIPMKEVKDNRTIKLITKAGFVIDKEAGVLWTRSIKAAERVIDAELCEVDVEAEKEIRHKSKVIDIALQYSNIHNFQKKSSKVKKRSQGYASL